MCQSKPIHSESINVPKQTAPVKAQCAKANRIDRAAVLALKLNMKRMF